MYPDNKTYVSLHDKSREHALNILWLHVKISQTESAIKNCILCRGMYILALNRNR